MDKFKKIFSALAVSIAFGALASCTTNAFYNEWHEAGADIKEENVFSLLTVDEVVAKREAKESFIVYIGSSSKDGAVSAVSDIQAQADNLDYDGLVYFVNTKDILKTTEGKKNATNKLNVHEIDSGDLVVLCYKKGNVYFDTSSSANDYYQRFIVNGALNYNALAAYTFEYYPVSKK